MSESPPPASLITEELGDELLVYDTATAEAHRLDGAAADRFRLAADELSRREVLSRLALAGAGTVLATTIAVPEPAAAQSTACVPACGKGLKCCTTGSTPHCEPQGAICCGNLGCLNNTVCCPSGACCPAAQCCTNPPCCMNTQVCVDGTCQQP
jgi:hypothetical protein